MLYLARESYYQIAKEFLDLIVGNEVSMQLRVNLSIQFQMMIALYLYTPTHGRVILLSNV